MLPDDLPALLRFRSLGYAMLMVSPDPIDFEIRALSSTSDLEAAIRLARIERAVLLGRLRRAGIRVVDWPTDQPLDRVLYNALARQMTRIRRLQLAGLLLATGGLALTYSLNGQWRWAWVFVALGLL